VPRLALSSYVTRKTTRLIGHDYREPGAYFVTLCIEDRKCLLGSIVDGAMRRNRAGDLIQRIWAELPEHYRFLQVDEFIVMPNHIHAIVMLTTDDIGIRPDDAIGLPALIQRFKAFSTREYQRMAKAESGSPSDSALWQRNYHDRVIRNEKELATVRTYIVNNPAQWHLDRENPDISTNGPTRRER